jgi:hypothetical protein
MSDSSFNLGSTAAPEEPEEEAPPHNNLPDAVLDVYQKEWLKFYYQEFLNAKAKKGTRKGNNGKKYVGSIVLQFLNTFYASLEQDARKNFSAVIHSVSSPQSCPVLPIIFH